MYNLTVQYSHMQKLKISMYYLFTAKEGKYYFCHWLGRNNEQLMLIILIDILSIISLQKSSCAFTKKVS